MIRKYYIKRLPGNPRKGKETAFSLGYFLKESGGTTVLTDLETLEREKERALRDGLKGKSGGITVFADFRQLLLFYKSA